MKRKSCSAKGSIHQEGITIINIYAPNNKAPKIHKTSQN